LRRPVKDWRRPGNSAAGAEAAERPFQTAALLEVPDQVDHGPARKLGTDHVQRGNEPAGWRGPERAVPSFISRRQARIMRRDSFSSHRTAWSRARTGPAAGAAAAMQNAGRNSRTRLLALIVFQPRLAPPAAARRADRGPTSPARSNRARNSRCGVRRRSRPESAAARRPGCRKSVGSSSGRKT